jgi:hypothetical protein
MLCLSWMLLAPKWPASAYISIPLLSFVIKDKSAVTTGEQ